MSPCRAAALLFLLTSLANSQPSSVRETTLVFPTYPYGDPDPVPSLTRNPLIYPYTVFDGFSTTSRDSGWKVLRLENTFISLDVLPGVGGKIFGATERGTGKQFIYTNDAVKFRRIALRGPWTSGGIEFNFGIVGHTPTTAAAVDHLTQTNKDGSATVFVGAMDLPSRTRWTVAITLPRDKAVIETQASWHNPTLFFRSQYSWSTAAVAAREDLYYSYPGTSMVPHGTALPNEPWPVDAQGRDVSFYRNNNFEGSKSNFVFGEYQPFFGTYAEGERMGLGHWALYDDMPGRKVWIWSLSRDGAIWENLLTDRRGQYSEPQAGRLFSQVDHEFLPPSTTEHWKELWFPIKEIGGITAAAPSVIMNVTWKDGTPTIALSALESWSDEVVASSGTKVILKEKVSLRPLQTWTRTPAWSEPPESLQVSVGRRLRFDNAPGASVLSRPIEYRSPPDSTPSGLYLQAERFEKERRLPEALASYQQCLTRDPLHIQALSRASLVSSWMGRDDVADSLARRALRLSKYDAAANYAFGVASRRSGRTVDAMEAFGWAARSPQFRSSAYTQLAELSILRDVPDQAATYAHRALSAGSENLSAHHALAVALRLSGDRVQARASAEKALELDPLDHQARFELALNESTPASMTRFSSAVTNEFPEHSFLEIALWYNAIGCTDEALRALDAGPGGTLTEFWQAYLRRDAKPDKSINILRTAVARPVEFVLPFREEELPLFRWAARVLPDAWTPRYYLALVLWSKGRMREAMDEVRLLSPRNAPAFYLSRAFLRRSLHEAGEGEDLAMAAAQRPGLWRTWHALNLFLGQQPSASVGDSALRTARSSLDKFPDNTVIRMDLANALYASGRFTECLALLDSTVVLPYEGSWEAHDLYRRAHLMSALEHCGRGDWDAAITASRRSTSYPEHLGTGEPWEPDRRAAMLLEAACMARQGKRAEADALLDTVNAYTRRHGIAWGSDHLAGVRALQLRGAEAEAVRLLTQLRMPAGVVNWMEKGTPVPSDRRREWSPQLRLQVDVVSSVKP